MRDPYEGLDAEGFITTGAALRHVPAAYEPVLEAAVSRVAEIPGGELHLYGSVATGQAVVGRSDVDLMTIGVPAQRSSEIAEELTARFSAICRAVEVGVAQPGDFAGPGDSAHGNRAFLRHYCVPLQGEDRYRPAEPFLGDVAAARGFNGDIAQCGQRWRAQHPDAQLGWRVARKTLLAVASLVSVHDATWTTDRAAAVGRWGVLRSRWRRRLAQLLSWSEGVPAPEHEVARALAPGGVVDAVVEDFADLVGLWPSPPPR